MLLKCPNCSKLPKNPCSEQKIVRIGYFIRQSDHKQIARFRCRSCSRSFSEATGHLCYYQKKRQFNYQILSLLVKSSTQRDIARHLGINRKTVASRLDFFGHHSHKFLWESNKALPLSSNIEFDDLETHEHSKMKPLSVILGVESQTRRILALKVARMPAKGLLSKKSVKKYGRRKDERAKKRMDFFEEIKPLILSGATIKSDQNPHYEPMVRKYFPEATYLQYKGRMARGNGHGELKKGYDPLFSLNHSCAMFRAHLSRLVRKTWATTKCPRRLEAHMLIYAFIHNVIWLPKLKAPEFKSLVLKLQLE